MSIEFLRRLPLFASLSEPDLERLYAQAREDNVPPGTVIIEEGTPGDAVYVLLEGELQITKFAAGHDVKVDVRKPGEVIGEMSLLDNAPRAASVRTLTQSRLLVISKDMFDSVLKSSPNAAMAVLHMVTARLRQNEALLHEKEKMAGLGTLAAGLAHELNNPAAAVRRAVSQLGDSLLNWQQAWSMARGTLNFAEASAVKVFATEFYVEAYQLLLEVMGQAGTLRAGSPGAVIKGRVERMYRTTLILTFGGGTNEVQRDIIAMAGLGLPAARRTSTPAFSMSACRLCAAKSRPLGQASAPASMKARAK